MFQNAISSSTQTNTLPRTLSTIDTQTQVPTRDVQTQASRTHPPSYSSVRDTQTAREDLESPPPPYSVAILMENWQSSRTTSDISPPPDYDSVMSEDSYPRNYDVTQTVIPS